MQTCVQRIANYSVQFELAVADAIRLAMCKRNSGHKCFTDPQRTPPAILRRGASAQPLITFQAAPSAWKEYGSAERSTLNYRSATSSSRLSSLLQSLHAPRRPRQPAYPSVCPAGTWQCWRHASCNRRTNSGNQEVAGSITGSYATTA